METDPVNNDPELEEMLTAAREHAAELQRIQDVVAGREEES
jgi:hypothetical protein